MLVLLVFAQVFKSFLFLIFDAFIMLVMVMVMVMVRVMVMVMVMVMVKTYLRKKRQ